MEKVISEKCLFKFVSAKICVYIYISAGWLVRLIAAATCNPTVF